MDINIATMTKPTDVDGFFLAIREAFPMITAGVIADGRGCSNYGFRIVAEDDIAEQIANQLTMTFMPAKWCSIENDGMILPGTFYDAR